MKIEYLDRIGYIRGRIQSGFLVDMMGDGIKDIINSEKKVILLGVGENCFFAEMLLYKKGLEVYGYADNSIKCQGQFLRGKQIFNPYECFKWENTYFIITTQLRYLSDVRLQFMVHNICNYGIFLNTNFYDFLDEDCDLHIQLMNAINEICFKETSSETVLPYGEWGNGDLGDCNWLLKSTCWSHWAYIWEKELLERSGRKVLEIGPGFGLMSLVLLKEFSDIEIDWIIFGEEKDVIISEGNNRFLKGLKKIKKWYGAQVNEIWGKIEREELSLPEGRYNLVFMTEVFEHFVLKPIEVMHKINKLLTDDGFLILTTPDWGHVHIYNHWEDMPENKEIDDERYEQLLKCGHTYQYSKKELENIFMLTGFEVVKYKLSDSNNHNYMLKKSNTIHGEECYRGK